MLSTSSIVWQVCCTTSAIIPFPTPLRTQFRRFTKTDPNLGCLGTLKTQPTVQNNSFRMMELSNK